MKINRYALYLLVGYSEIFIIFYSNFSSPNHDALLFFSYLALVIIASPLSLFSEKISIIVCLISTGFAILTIVMFFIQNIGLIMFLYQDGKSYVIAFGLITFGLLPLILFIDGIINIRNIKNIYKNINYKTKLILISVPYLLTAAIKILITIT